MLAVPVAGAIAFAAHLAVYKNETPMEARTYTNFLATFLIVSILIAVGQHRWHRLRVAVWRMRPLFTAAVLLLCAWELITAGWHWLPLPYFPSPAAVLQSMISDRTLLFDSTWHSLVLLLAGYFLGAHYSQGIPQQIEADNCQGDANAWQHRQPPFAREDVLLCIGKHAAPAGARRLNSQSNERQ